MNNSNIFKILYYICFVFSVFIWILTSNFINELGTMNTSVNIFLGIINIVLVIIFTIKLIKKKLNNITILFPILYLVFSIIVIIIAFIVNSKLVIPYMHFSYYISFILFNYLLLNIYSTLSLSKSKSIYK